MDEQTLKLDIPLLLPDVEDARDEVSSNCMRRLQQNLEHHKGVLHSHMQAESHPPKLCIHFDPNITSLSALRRAAQRAGADFRDSYRHERIPFEGLEVADAARGLDEDLENLPRMQHARVNYAAGLAFVAYDIKELSRDRIESHLLRFGVRPVAPETAAVEAPEPTRAAEQVEDHEMRGPAFLPNWIPRRWTLVLIALAAVFFLTGWLGGLTQTLPERITLIFFILTYITAGFDVATHAIPGLLKGRFDTDVLMLAAAVGAALIGQWTEGALLLLLFGLGHAGEHYALDRARNAVNALGELMPGTARVRRGDTIEELPVEQVQLGDVVLVRPGDRLPIDGVVLSGSSAVDQSAITGESVPHDKAAGDEVYAGTINRENALEIHTTRQSADNTLNRVMNLVAEAQEQTSPTQQFTQRFTSRFVPAVLGLTVLVMVMPPLLGWLPFRDSFYRAMLLLVAASPCALAVGTPAAVLAGIAQAARRGVLIKGGAHLENLGAIRVMAFDKTGTLTTGQFTVTDIVPLNGSGAKRLLQVTAAAEQQSNHPLALAVVRAAREKKLALPAADRLENVPGSGVRSQVEGRELLIGSLKLFANQNGGPQTPPEALRQTVARLEAEGKTTMAVKHGDEFLGVLALADVARTGVRGTLQKLIEMGVQKLVMLTGDNETVARQIAAEVGVTDVCAGLLPEQKLDVIRGLQQEHGAIAMTGDGVNDAPALATATVGIAMGGAGTAVALETADVALMADDLSQLPFAVGLSRASRRIIHQNMALALGVIGLLIISSVLGIVALREAVVLHEGSTILVVLNALRLLRYK